MIRPAIFKRGALLSLAVFAFAVAPALWNGAAMAQADIGKAAAVKNNVHGTRGNASRSLSTGGSVFNDDHVKAEDNSLAQLLFVDQTTFTVASNSEAILNRVFHPQQGVTQLVMRAVVGAFRFVSGVQSSQHYRIEFPQGYITVRGTIIDLLVWPTRTVIILDEGAITVVPYATGIPYDLDRAGTSLVVYSDCHVDGPMTWDSTIVKIGGTLPFPLFGNTIWPAQGGFQQFDSRKDLNDILVQLGQRGAGGGGGGVFCPPPGVILVFNGVQTCSP
jgi:hypothetical protein